MKIWCGQKLKDDEEKYIDDRGIVWVKKKEKETFSFKDPYIYNEISKISPFKKGEGEN